MQKIYTKHKRNSAGQIAQNCLDYNNSHNIDETCMLKWTGGLDNLCACRVRFGEVCPYFEGKL